MSIDKHYPVFDETALREEIVFLKKELKEEKWRHRQWEKAAMEWMAEYDKLKDKYEPEFISTT